jgi:mRNA-degrading endonuclease YafQ of YafQ-DinJ toxin-antitoxin module
VIRIVVCGTTEETCAQLRSREPLPRFFECHDVTGKFQPARNASVVKSAMKDSADLVASKEVRP